MHLISVVPGPEPNLMSRFVLTLLMLTALAVRPSYADPGVLLLAHGGAAEWNTRVTELAARVNDTQPTEVAFGMATRAEIQGAVDRLVARGVTEIIAVPLFVSSSSTIITSTEYLLGLRPEAPAALAVFARMSHGSHGAPAAPAAPASDTAAHAGHGSHTGHGAPVDGTTPVAVPVPVRMTPALDDHPLVADILLSRARSISQRPANEALVIVAHGPNEEDDNRRWLAAMTSLADRIRTNETFASIDTLTVRDDAPAEVRNQATAELRAVVERHTQAGRRVLVVPLVISFGGIERGLRTRLEGLDYAMPTAGLMPDDRLVDLVLARASAR